MAVPTTPEEAGGGLSLVTNGINGFNYPAGNIAELTDRLTRLLNNEIMRVILGKRSFQKAKNYNWDVIAKSYEKKLTELVDNKIQ
jgi:glycosyltransferase involved in cell wall biosynthesis